MSDVDLLALHDGAVTEVQRLIEGVAADQLDAPTPDADWNVQSLIGHLIAGNRRFAAAAKGESLMPLIGDIASDHDGAAYAESAGEATVAWSDPAALAQDNSAMSLTVHSAEAVMHGWDLARATGQTATFDDDLLAEIESFGRQNMPAERPAEMGFGPAREAPADASRLDRLAAFYGREV
ncbi:MAG: TIGR03086 family metal-binding protein [Actinomycetota bacterium]